MSYFYCFFVDGYIDIQASYKVYDNKCLKRHIFYVQEKYLRVCCVE